jgi:hypothetical protein
MISAVEYITNFLNTIKQHIDDEMYTYLKNDLLLQMHPYLTNEPSTEKAVSLYFYNTITFDPFIIKWIPKEYQTYNSCKLAISENAWSVFCLDDPSIELQKLAIKQNWRIFEKVKDQTLELFKLAIESCGHSIDTLFNSIRGDVSNEIKEYAVSVNGLLLKNIKNQTQTICNIAVMENCDAYIYVDTEFLTVDLYKLALLQNVNIIENITQSEELCMYAIKLKASVIAKIKNQTPKLCKMALRQDGYLLSKIKIPLTEEFCLIAVKQNGSALQYVPPKYQTYNVCKSAIKQNPSAKKYILNVDLYDATKNMLVDQAMKFVSRDGTLLEMVEEDNQTEEMCIMAIQNNPNAINFVANKTEKILKLVEDLQNIYIQKETNIINNYNYINVKNIVKSFDLATNKEQTDEECKSAVMKDGLQLKFVIEQTPEICMMAIKQNPEALKFVVIPQTFEMCRCAIEQNGLMFEHVDTDHVNGELLAELYRIALNQNIKAMHCRPKFTKPYMFGNMLIIK